MLRTSSKNVDNCEDASTIPVTVCLDEMPGLPAMGGGGD